MNFEDWVIKQTGERGELAQAILTHDTVGLIIDNVTCHNGCMIVSLSWIKDNPDYLKSSKYHHRVVEFETEMNDLGESVSYQIGNSKFRWDVSHERLCVK